MRELPYGLSYATRLVPDGTGTVLYKQLMLPWPQWGGKAVINRLLADLAPYLSGSRLDIAEDFANTAFEFGRRGGHVLLLQKDEAIYFEVVTKGLHFWQTWHNQMTAKKSRRLCGSYTVDGRRALWVKFD